MQFQTMIDNINYIINEFRCAVIAHRIGDNRRFWTALNGGYKGYYNNTYYQRYYQRKYQVWMQQYEMEEPYVDYTTEEYDDCYDKWDAKSILEDWIKTNKEREERALKNEIMSHYYQ